MVECDETHLNKNPWRISSEESYDNNECMIPENNTILMSEPVISEMLLKTQSQQLKNKCSCDSSSSNLAANVLSAAGAAFLSAVIVNPLDVAKMINLQSGINQEVGCFFVRNKTIGNILCCKCGSPTPPNKANMCLHCLRMESHHIIDDLPSQVSIIQCRECMSYLQPPKTWLKAESESKELLSFCLGRLKKLPEFQLNCAEFLFTEPHSKRIKLRIKVQQEVLD